MCCCVVCFFLCYCFRDCVCYLMCLCALFVRYGVMLYGFVCVCRLVCARVIAVHAFVNCVNMFV